MAVSRDIAALAPPSRARQAAGMAISRDIAALAPPSRAR